MPGSPLWPEVLREEGCTQLLRTWAASWGLSALFTETTVLSQGTHKHMRAHTHTRMCTRQCGAHVSSGAGRVGYLGGMGASKLSRTAFLWKSTKLLSCPFLLYLVTYF